MKFSMMRSGAILAAAMMLGAAAPAVAPMSLAALDLIQPGLWHLEGKGRAARQVCVAEDAMALVQVEHSNPGCRRFVIDNQPKSATVHYSCEHAGWGRTTVRVESPVQAQIQTQGISHNAPFEYVLDARRVGDCGGGTPATRR